MTLGDILAKVGIGGGGAPAPAAAGPAAGAPKDPRSAYLMYAEDCMMQNQQPMRFPDWMKAGAPAKCVAAAPAP